MQRKNQVPLLGDEYSPIAVEVVQHLIASNNTRLHMCIGIHGQRLRAICLFFNTSEKSCRGAPVPHLTRRAVQNGTSRQPPCMYPRRHHMVRLWCLQHLPARLCNQREQHKLGPSSFGPPLLLTQPAWASRHAGVD